jgi:hypothetical protein|tara:strand:- start:1015 stop:1458 length:444 start_codon:yes stop_codon:yes gene_type:complete
MTKKDLVKIIQEVVKREVQKEVKKIFIKEQVSEEPTIEMKSIVEEPKEQVKYTKNESLNKVLNETVGLSKSQSQTEAYPTLGGGTFDTNKMTELLGYGKPEEVQRDMVAADTLRKAGKSVNDVPEHVTNALTRDYSDLMKAINKKGK